MGTECFACKVVKKEIELQISIENENAIGILIEAEPIAVGHCLIFPKNHFPKFHDIPSAGIYSDMMVLIKKFTVAMDLQNYNILQNNGSMANQHLFHVHFHLIPKWSENEGLIYDRNFPKNIDQSEMSALLKEMLD
ncbi:MAG: HIT domain-containing protein [Candidatus Kariarchaeaceae archaeon]|jgi:diadenosine tetraphosphate (Ap4A) HIT family hydrolase